jgi:hypothetical protein
MLSIILGLVENTGCASITITDATGNYDPVLNPTGWGAPNDTIASITAAQVTITNSYTAAAVVEDIFADIASMFTTGITLTSADLFGSGTFPDGYYEFHYEVVANGTTYHYYYYTGLHCVVECCTRREALTLKYPICDFKSVERAATMTFMFADLNWAACCDNQDYFNTILTELEKWCSANGSLGTNQLSNSGCGCS